MLLSKEMRLHNIAFTLPSLITINYELFLQPRYLYWLKSIELAFKSILTPFEHSIILEITDNCVTQVSALYCAA